MPLFIDEISAEIDLSGTSPPLTPQQLDQITSHIVAALRDQQHRSDFFDAAMRINSTAKARGPVEMNRDLHNHLNFR